MPKPRLLGSASPRSLATSRRPTCVIEAVFEDFDLKARLLAELSPILRADAIVATNTSCLRVGDLARHLRRPERFLGLHYFSPAAVNPIVEVVQGAATADATVEAALALLPRERQAAAALPRLVWLCRQSLLLSLHQPGRRRVGSGPRHTGEIDAVARNVLGAAAGPFAVMNLIKPRINLHAIRNLGPARRRSMRRPKRLSRRGRPTVHSRSSPPACPSRYGPPPLPTTFCGAASSPCCRPSTRT